MDAGSRIEVVMTKWGGRPHWRYGGVYLGHDTHGEWLGFPVGTYYRRPGMAFTADFACVSLVPDGDAPHFAGFYEPDHDVAVYVDMTTPPMWDGDVVEMIDLDLDVVWRRTDPAPYVADEDEFTEHRERFGYPADVVAMAERSAREVLAAVEGRQAPYDGTAGTWLAALAALTSR